MLHQGKSGIVTGAAQGIGRACAERLAREGARVALADVNAAEVKIAADSIIAAGGTAVAIACDVRSKGEVDALIASTVAAYGSVDLLVNNAGVVDDCPFLDLSEAELDRVLSVNLKGAFLVGQAAARQMARQRDTLPDRAPGSIVNMSP